MERTLCNTKAIIIYQMSGDNIFTVTFKEFIPLEDILNYLDEFNKLDYLPKNLNILYDFTMADFELSQSSLKIISEKAIEVTKRFESIRTAFLISEPKITAYAMLLSLMIPNRRAVRDIFSTRTGAEDWLLGNR